MNIRILNQRIAEAAFIHEPHVIISITGSKHGIANVEAGRGGCKEVLRLTFDDAGPGWTQFQEETQLFTDKDADLIADFVEIWKDKVQIIVVHCLGGISRSSGVAAAIHYALNGKDSCTAIFNDGRYVPNSYVYNKTLNALHSKNLCQHMNTPVTPVE
jgi:predicted protein tyrosine phosphatase